MEPRLVITGSGVVSALGCGKAVSLEALRDCRSGIGPDALGRVPLSGEALSALTGAPADWPRTTLLSIVALKEALSEAGLLPEGRPLPGAFARTGSRSDAEEERGLPSGSLDIPLIGGTTVGGMDLTERQYPVYSPWHSCGASTDLAARFLGFGSWASTLSTACSSAANALIYAARLILSGRAACVVAGGSESLSQFHIDGFRSLMILDSAPCRPFDATRAGLNLGEGAAYLVLESEEHALRRGARPLAVLSGWGNACDAFHQTASSENGEGAFLAMQQALRRAGLSPADIGYVNAHGTGTPSNDASESAALRRLFGDTLPPVSSTKPFTGHTTSASGSIEAVFCLLALQQGFIPPQLNFRTPDPACIEPASGGTAALQHVLSNAFGFGGNDSSLILSAYDA